MFRSMYCCVAILNSDSFPVIAFKQQQAKRSSNFISCSNWSSCDCIIRSFRRMVVGEISNALKVWSPSATVFSLRAYLKFPTKNEAMNKLSVPSNSYEIIFSSVLIFLSNNIRYPTYISTLYRYYFSYDIDEKMQTFFLQLVE